MLRIHFILVSLLISTISFCQKVDLDNFRIPIEYAEFPDHCIQENQRNYNVSINGSSQFVDSDFLEHININGCEWTDSLAEIQAFVSTQRFSNGKSVSSYRTDVKKDKDGKVVSRTKYYKVSGTNRGRGYLEVYGPDNSYSKHKKELRKTKSKKKEKKEKKKKKTRAELKKEAQQKEMESNPFLKDVDVSDVELEEQPPTEREMKYPKVYTKSLNFDYTYTTREYRNKQQAYDEYVSNSDDYRYQHKNKFFNDVVKTVNAKLNYLYGYKKETKKVRFLITDSKKHPENENYVNAMKATKVIFSKMKFDEPIGEFADQLKPIIEYLNGVANKYTGNKKREKKLRHSAYHNLAYIHYYLDQPENVIEAGNAIIATGYKESSGKDFVKIGKELKSLLKFHNVSARHIINE